MPLDLCIIIVSWNVRDLLRDCLASLVEASEAISPDGALRLGRHTAEVHVVDNASTDGTVEMVQEIFPWVRLTASDRNLGFAGGNNLALRHCQGRYALLLNPDTRVEENALPRMLGYMDAHPWVGVLGPQLWYGNGQLQSSRRRFPNLLTAMMESTLLAQWFPANRWFRAYHVMDRPDDQTQVVDWVVGACMLVRRRAIEQVGLLDEGFFMYSEELDWCRRIVDAGWQVVYYPHALVTHYEGQSSGQVLPQRHIRFQTSKIRYFAKHHGWLQAGVLRAFLLLNYVWWLGEDAVKYLLGNRRAMRRERMRTYGQVIRSRLKPPVEGRAP